MTATQRPKLSELVAIRDRCEPSAALLAAIRCVLSPPRQATSSVHATLNKLTAKNFEKLAPTVPATAESTDALLKFTVTQNEYVGLYAKLLRGMNAAYDTAPHVDAYARDTALLVRDARDMLRMREQYDEFCDVIKHRKELLSRVRSLRELHALGDICDGIRATIAGCSTADDEFAIETLVDALAIAADAATLQDVCAGLLLDTISFKLRFKIERVMREPRGV